MDAFINPILVYCCLALGGLGVALALPRKRVNPQVIGALVAGLAFGVIFIALGVSAREAAQLPNLYFYAFALIALGSGLRVITHQRPVYSALYFILTILASSGLYLLLDAEFMAFALIIIYAGAILITYLFVIMLATQAPSEEEVDKLSDYDASAREPWVATVVGFVLLAVLTTLMATGVEGLRPRGVNSSADAALLAELPGKVEGDLRRHGVRGFELGEGAVDVGAGIVTLTITDEDALRGSMEREHVRDYVRVIPTFAPTPGEVMISIPEGVEVTNTDGVGWALVAEHPMALELAGIILLMAMLGAVVLARKQIEIGEDEKAERARMIASARGGEA
ncbi:MAG: NADH-quinone oxidoreductase subunit J [Phycisphaerales bacterium]|nr:NADH-quinone oxidoreductase subunit J [Phycisphaerales bacterium]